MKITKRHFLISGAVVGGGMLVGAGAVGTWVGTFDRRSLQQDALGPKGEDLIAQWIRIDPTGLVTLISPHTEMGQGSQTSLLQIVLDELDSDPARTVVEVAPADPAFSHSDAITGLALGAEEAEGAMRKVVEKAMGRVGQVAGIQFTGGSTAIRFTGWRGIRRAAADARTRLAEAGASELGVPVGEVTTRNGEVVHERSGQRVGYGDIASTAAALPIVDEPKFKDPSSWRYIGTSHPRIDIPDKVFGAARYGIDVEVPGMRHAAVAPAPKLMGRVTGVRNESKLRAMPGVESIVVLEDGVAVVADNPWRAERAVARAEIDCDAPETGALESKKLAKARRSAVLGDSEAKQLHEIGEGAAELAGDDVIVAEYSSPWLAHAPMEPLNATVWEEGEQIHFATGVQGPLAARRAAADALGRPFEDITLHSHTMGGGFGRRNGLASSSLNWVTMAGRIHAAVGGAIKMTWSREADMRLSRYRPADHAVMRAKLGADGRPTHWWGRSFASVSAVPETLPPYQIPHITVETLAAEPETPYCYWRSVDAWSHATFIECFIDELAEAAGEDPLTYRLSLLEPASRHARALRKVGEMARWPDGPSEGRGLGVAVSEGFGSVAAVVVEASHGDGGPRVHRAFCALDCGLAIHPGSAEVQMEGGIHWAISAALWGRIDSDERGGVVQSNFHDYRIVSMADAPHVTTEIITDPTVPVGGVGEVSTPVAGAAVLNALARVGERPRHLPVVA